MKNMGTPDRIIRLLAAMAIAAAYALGFIGGTMAIVLGIIAAILVLTSLVAICPAYLPFGLSTRHHRR